MIWEWILWYVVPASLTVFFAIRQKSWNARLITIHIGLLVSISLLIFSGSKIYAGFQIYPLILLMISVILAAILMKRLSVMYIVSSIIQESCILLAAILLSFQIGIAWAAIATAMVYSLAHMADPSQWSLKLSITFLWGIFSILLYYYMKQPILNFALHIGGGAILIRLGFLYYGKGEWIRSAKTVLK